MIRYGAKSLPYGGWLTVPRIYGNGWCSGDSASFLNSQRLKGIHLAMKSGMLAAESAFAALRSGDSSLATLGETCEVNGSWIHKEQSPVRNFHQDRARAYRGARQRGGAAGDGRRGPLRA